MRKYPSVDCLFSDATIFTDNTPKRKCFSDSDIDPKSKRQKQNPGHGRFRIPENDLSCQMSSDVRWKRSRVLSIISTISTRRSAVSRRIERIKKPGRDN